MCGIAGIHRLSNRPVPKLDELASALLTGIESRGRDATGYVAIDDAGGVQLQKASCSAFYFNRHRAKIASDARTVLLHTRFATQGKPAFPENNHPVEAGGIYAVHNGHIWNDADVFAQTAKPRRGEVDSEAIPALVACRGWEAAPQCLGELQGDLAVALIDTKRPGDLILARGNHSPLYYVRGRDFLLWASTHDAIVAAWRATLGTPPAPGKIRYMMEGDSLVIRSGVLSSETWIPANDWRQPATTYRPWLGRAVSRVCSVSVIDESEETESEGSFGWECCDDCGDWFTEGELHSVQTVVGDDMLCASCLDWAIKADAVKTKTRVSL